MADYVRAEPAQSIWQMSYFCRYMLSLHKHCVTHPLACALAVLVAFMWITGVLVWLVYTPTPPIVPFGQDSVTPTRVRPSDVIHVWRTRHITRDVVVKITRRMVKGDCSVKCTTLTLDAEDALLRKGTQINNSLEHIIPRRAVPGIWRLEFAATWQDAFGRTHSTTYPTLTIEVIE